MTEFTPEQDAYYRKRLLADYDRLIQEIDEMFPRMGDQAMFIIRRSDLQLVQAALRQAKSLQEAK